MKEIPLRKIIEYGNGIEDIFGHHYYYIYTKVYCEKDAEYLLNRGWLRVEKEETFWGAIKRWTKAVF